MLRGTGGRKRELLKKAYEKSHASILAVVPRPREGHLRGKWWSHKQKAEVCIAGRPARLGV